MQALNAIHIVQAFHFKRWLVNNSVGYTVRLVNNSVSYTVWLVNNSVGYTVSVGYAVVLVRDGIKTANDLLNLKLLSVFFQCHSNMYDMITGIHSWGWFIIFHII